MSDFTDEQLTTLKAIADAKLAEDKEIAERNTEVDAHSAKLDELNKQVLDLATAQGIDPSTFQIAPTVTELTGDHQNFQDFSKQVSELAQEQGLGDFEIRKVNP